MSSEKVYFSLGSNIEPRKKHLFEAISLMNEQFGTAPEAVSQIFENPAVGFKGGDFMNCAVRYSLEMEPLEVLDICKGIEKRMGRDLSVRYDERGKRIYSDRVIDIDIIYFGERIIDTPRLTIPHPRAAVRPFVQIPLSEILERK